MKKRNNNQLHKKIFCLPIAFLLMAALVLGLVNLMTQQVKASATLPGIEEIIMNNSSEEPFVILEVLPDKKDARMGYLAAGEEPVDDSAKAFSDMPSTAERAARSATCKDIPSDLSDAVSYTAYQEVLETDDTGDAVKKTQKVNGSFIDMGENNGDYAKSGESEIYSNNAEAVTAEAGTDSGVLYRKYASFYTDEGTDSYSLTIKRMDENTVVPALISGEDTLSKCFNYQFFSVDQITDDSFSNADDGALIFKGSSSGEYMEYYGIVTHSTAQMFAAPRRKGNISVSPAVISQTPSASPEVTPQVSNHPTESVTPETAVTPETTAVPEATSTPEATSAPEATLTPINDADSGVTDKLSVRFEKAIAANDNSYITKADGSEELLSVIAASDDYENYYVVHESQGSDVGKDQYYISSVSKGSGVYHVNDSYGVVERDENGTYANITADDISNGLYYIRTNTPEYIYRNGDTSYHFNYAFLEDKTGEEADSFLYINGFSNNEWLKKNVFNLEEDALEHMVVDIVPVTMEELNTYDLTEVDMLYFAGGAYPTKMDDDSSGSNTAFNIASKVLYDSMPVILNRSVFEAVKPDNSGVSQDDGLLKLCACLMQNNLQGLDSAALTSAWAQGGASFFNSLKAGMHSTLSNAEYSYVNENVYVYDDTDFANDPLTPGNPLVSNDFNTAFSDDKTAEGFQALIDEIDSENFYLKNAGKTETIPKLASKATAIRYIINYGNQRVPVKSNLNILDIEPYDSSAYYMDGTIKQGMVAADGKGVTVSEIASDSIAVVNGNWSKEWITTNLASNLLGKEDAITIHMMGTHELIGKLEDLNANYDMIYIGMDTSIMNTAMDGTKKTNQTVYNDSNMNGLVYSHLGDRITTSDYRMSGTYRMSGNDITTDKKAALEDYVKAGYALLLSDYFFVTDDAGNVTGIDETRLDISSNLYAFIRDTVLKKDNGNYVYFGNNVNTKGNIENGTDEVSTRFIKHINIGKLIVNYNTDDLPPAYNAADGSHQYLSMDGNGDYPLSYTFSLDNDAAVDIGNTSYDCSLYIDIDADGRFEKMEQQSGLTVTKKNGDNWDSEYVDNDGRFHLKAGYTYQVSKIVPEGFTGLLSWKMIFSQNADENASETEKENTALIRREISGFSAVASPQNVPTVKILQICSGDNGTGGNLNLKSSEMQNLYSQLSDFHVEIEQISASNYIKKKSFTDTEYYDYLCNYNMVVMGFADMYSFTGNEEQCREAVLGIRKYVLSGRSILFTHDLNSFDIKAKTSWGYYINLYLRDVQGMDRFGNLLGNTYIPSDEEYQYHSVFDSSVLKGNNEDNVGFSDPTMAEYRIGGTDYGLTARKATYNFTAHGGSSNNYSYSKGAEVSMINEGQITQYPFLITTKENDTFTVSHTHAQYFQLNLDTNSLDDNTNDDVVVWYTINGYENTASDTFFKADKNDTRNNFYIYNKGNITYTGSGDSTVNRDMERKLFVNTMIASYNAGIHAPLAVFKESKIDTSAEIHGLYIPYDPQISETNNLNDKLVTLNFKTVNNNLLYSTEQLYAKYYVEVPKSAATTVIGSKYLKEINPQSFQKILPTQDGLSITDADRTILSNYTMYTMQFTRSELGLTGSSGIGEDNTFNFYIRLSTEPITENILTSQKACESLNKLNIVYTELFELK